MFFFCIGFYGNHLHTISCILLSSLHPQVSRVNFTHLSLPTRLVLAIQGRSRYKHISFITNTLIFYKSTNLHQHTVGGVHELRPTHFNNLELITWGIFLLEFNNQLSTLLISNFSDHLIQCPFEKIKFNHIHFTW